MSNQKIDSNQASFATGGGSGTLTVKEVDGVPTVVDVDTIVVSNGTLTDDGGGQVTLTTGGGGGAPAGSDKAVQYNNASSFGGVTLNATATKKYLQQVSSGTPSFQQVAYSEVSGTPTIPALEVKEADGSPDVNNVTQIIVTNGKLTDNGGGSVSLDLSSGGGVARSGSTTDGHLAVWNGSNADSIKDGGTVPSVPSVASSVTAETSYGASSNAGSASTYSKGDHTHGTPSLSANTPAAVAGTATAGSGTAPSKDDHAHVGVHSVAKSGSSALVGDVTLSEGANVTLTQSGNNIAIAAAGASSSLEVKEADGSPDVSNVSLIIVSNGTLTDNGGGSVSITTGGGGGLSQSYLGYNTVGGSTEGMTQYRVYMKKITLATAGVITSIGAYLASDTADHVVSFSIGLYTDSSGSPLQLIGTVTNRDASTFLKSTASAQTPRWLEFPCGIYAPAGDYWIAIQCFETTAYGIIYYDGSGSDRYYTAGGSWQTDAGYTTVTTSSNKYSIRASVIH